MLDLFPVALVLSLQASYPENGMSLDSENKTMHKIFGIEEKAEYYTRKGAYLIPIKDGKIAVAETPKGFFLLGGGIEPGESEPEAIVRECMEEVGCIATVDRLYATAEAYTVHPRKAFFHPVQSYYLGSISVPVCTPKEDDHKLLWLSFDEIYGRMFSQMQNWAIKVCWEEVNK